MSETKTYVFGNDGQCGGGGMMSLLAPLLQRNGLDPNLLLAMNKNSNGWGEGGGFMWVIFNRFYADCALSGTPIPWEDILDPS